MTPFPAADLTPALAEQVRSAAARRTPLNIIGGNSKAFYGRPASGEPLKLDGHSGILEYEPTELVLTARSGTRLAEIEAALAQHQQMLAFEPPHFGETATLGGTVACGFSGPRRPYAGAVRDSLLGVTLLNGDGDALRFGGQVIKNVAGFDVARLMAGALGTLGVLLDVSLKVVPLPEQDVTLQFALTAEAALAAMNRWAGEHWPLSAAAYHDGSLWLRLSGADSAVQAACADLGGENIGTGADFWQAVREQTLPFFDGPQTLWRLSVPAAAPQLPLAGDCLLDWGGALRWLKTDAPAAEVFAAARSMGGHASQFRRAAAATPVFQPMPPNLLALQRRLKQAFDPKGLFNPHRLLEDG